MKYPLSLLRILGCKFNINSVVWWTNLMVEEEMIGEKVLKL